MDLGVTALVLETFVYFTECADSIKIGYSREPEQRAKALRGSLLATAPGGRRLESLLHKRFDHLRTDRIPRPGNGDTEHFHKDPDLLDFIGRVIAGEHPENILTAEDRARDDREYADLVRRSRGNDTWLQAHVVLTYGAGDYAEPWDSMSDRRTATEQMFAVELAWECLDAGACSCLCHDLRRESRRDAA